MPKLRLTEKAVEKIQNPSEGEIFFWDTEMAGFGLRVTTASKIFIFQTRMGATGKNVRVKLGVYPALTLKVAEKLAKDNTALIASGVNPNCRKATEKARAVTLRQVWEAYRRDKTLSDTTIFIYESALRLGFESWLDQPLASITKARVEEKMLELSKRKGKHSAESGAKAHANQCMRVLRSLFNFAAIEYEDVEGRSLFPDNPVKRLSQKKMWNKAVKRQRVLLPHQIKPWYDALIAVPNTTARDYLLFLLFTGLRRTQGAAVKWSNVDFENRSIRFDPKTVKMGEDHAIPMSDFVMELLQARKNARESKKVRNLKSDAFVFPGDGATGHIIEPKETIKRVIKATNAPWSPHDLRRTFATTADRLDFTFSAIKQLLNHKGGDVTSQYIIVGIDRMRDPMQKVADEFKRIMEFDATAAHESAGS